MHNSVARLARTVRHLRWEQVVGRAVRQANVLPRRAVRVLGAFGASSARTEWEPPSDDLRAYHALERSRVEPRLAFLANADPLLCSYERSYGRELVDSGGNLAAAVSGPHALDPYPASVRTRSLAACVRMGRSEYAPHVTTAARAVLGQLEFALHGNHLLENAVALSSAGLALIGREATLFGSVGRWLLERELREQFTDDGGHFERSATYHCWVLAALLELEELYRSAGSVAPPILGHTIQRALSFLAVVIAPDDTVPLLNDAALDAAPSRRAIAHLCRATRREWLGTPPSVVALAQTGWVVARTDRAFVVADVGEIGAPYVAGHAHADSLSFELWVSGQRVVVDPGVATYRKGASRAWTRSTAAHNTVCVDDIDSSEVWGEFRVGRRAHTRLIDVSVADGIVRWVAEHDGYSHLTGSPIHRRSFELRTSQLTVTDTVSGGGTHTCSSSLLFDRQASQIVTLSAADQHDTNADAWYPCHGRSRAAIRAVWRRTVRLPWTAEWTLNW